MINSKNDTTNTVLFLKTHILALDQGTTSSRALLIDHEGKITAKAQKEFQQIFPHPGWVEHKPDDIWASQASVVAEVLAKAHITAENLHAIGITNQRETTLVWDRKTGKALTNAIVWQDRRTTDFCLALKKRGLEQTVREKTGLLLDPYFSGTKLHWVLENIPGAREKANKGELAFGTVDSWLAWKLTGGKRHITDVTNASRTLMFNIHTGKWDDDLLAILEIPASVLPEVVSCSEVYGTTQCSLFAHPVPISGMAGDQQASLFGQTCTKPGMAKATYGTGGFMLLNTGKTPVLSNNKLLTTIAYEIQGKRNYALEGSVFVAGAAVQWLRDNLKIIPSSDAIESLAAEVPDNGGVYFVPAFTGLGAPHWDPHARGMVLGLTRGTKQAHLARAVLEGIAFQVTDVLKAMEADSNTTIQELRVDGGAVKDNLLMQMQADFLGTKVIRPKVTELTALGAAFLAGLATNFWSSMEEIASFWQVDRVFTPALSPEVVTTLRKNWSKAITCAKLWGETST